MKKKRKEYQFDWSKFNEVAQEWDELLNRLGIYGLSELMQKTPSFKAYEQRYPLDNIVNRTELLDITEIQIQDTKPSLEEEAAERLETEALIANLTPRQKEIFDALYTGKTSLQIEIEQGYNTNNAVRWHKHQIKKKYKSIKADRYEQRFEFVCRECGNVFDGLVIDSACPLCGSDDCLFTKQYFKPIFDE